MVISFIYRTHVDFPEGLMFGNLPAPPVTTAPVGDDGVVEPQDGLLELIDGSAFRGISFGAEGKSVAGECVFQTGELTCAKL